MIKDSDIEQMFAFYAANESIPQSKFGDPILQVIQDRCNSLWSRDYRVTLLRNDGELCPTYPPQIVLVMAHLDFSSEDTSNPHWQTTRSEVDIIQSNMLISKDCRTRSRFPVSVININGKNICRSAGLVEKAEMMYKIVKTNDIKGILAKGIHASKNEARNLDINWLKMLKIHYIIDLMNEKTRTFMGIVPLCSGEVTSGDYRSFAINSMPFPGVNAYKSFKEERDQNVPLPETGRRVKENDGVAVLELSDKDFVLPHPHGPWDTYRSWNVVLLLQNYMRYIFYLLRKSDDKAGLLIHCISGWDRTPMFVGIIRILLWAEGLVHQSLDVEQMLFLVVGYDWLLFGHQLISRLKEGSQILYFSFWVLQHLLDDEFSLNPPLTPPPISIPSNTAMPGKQMSASLPTSYNSSESSTENMPSPSSEKKFKIKEDERPSSWRKGLRRPESNKELTNSAVVSPRRYQSVKELKKSELERIPSDQKTEDQNDFILEKSIPAIIKLGNMPSRSPTPTTTRETSSIASTPDTTTTTTITSNSTPCDHISSDTQYHSDTYLLERRHLSKSTDLLKKTPSSITPNSKSPLKRPLHHHHHHLLSTNDSHHKTKHSDTTVELELLNFDRELNQHNHNHNHHNNNHNNHNAHNHRRYEHHSYSPTIESKVRGESKSYSLIKDRLKKKKSRGKNDTREEVKFKTEHDSEEMINFSSLNISRETPTPPHPNSPSVPNGESSLPPQPPASPGSLKSMGPTLSGPNNTFEENHRNHTPAAEDYTKWNQPTLPINLNSRQQKILDVWNKFKDIYARTIEPLHGNFK